MTEGTTTMADTTPGLRLAALTKSLGGRRIVDSLALDVHPGEMLALLGPSGCGKTTTLRMIAGFLSPDAGRVEIAGRDVTALGPERRPSAMVFQQYALWPHMTVFRNVAYPLRVRGVDRHEITRRVDEVLALVHLTHHRDSRPAQISGGEQQRVALARALVQQPDLLLLDEPLSNLDAKLRVQVREEIRTLQRSLGITTIIVTHDQDEALSISDRIAVMHDGRIEQVSTPSELYARPATEFVAQFVGSVNSYEGVLRDGAVRPGPGTIAIRPEHIEFRLEARDGALPAVVRSVVPRGHFHEVVLEREDVTLRAYMTGRIPDEGTRGWARVQQALRYRDGHLQEVVEGQA